MCKISGFICSLCHTASMLILVVMAVERYVVLVCGFRGHQLITIRRLGVSTCINLFSFESHQAPSLLKWRESLRRKQSFLFLQLSIVAAWALSALLNCPHLLYHPTLLHQISLEDGMKSEICVPHPLLRNSVTADTIYTFSSCTWSHSE